MLGETEKSSDVCRTASLSEMGHEQRAASEIKFGVSVAVRLFHERNAQVLCTAEFNKLL